MSRAQYDIDLLKQYAIIFLLSSNSKNK